MTFVKFNPFFPAVSKDIDRAVNDFLNRPIGSVFKDEVPFNTPAINVQESEKDYTISLAAPGLEKKDFKIDLDKGILTISASKEPIKLAEGTKSTRTEFNYFKFKHSFTMPEDIDSSNIKAEYTNGILVIELPKLEEKTVKPTKIIVS